MVESSPLSGKHSYRFSSCVQSDPSGPSVMELSGNGEPSSQSTQTGLRCEKGPVRGELVTFLTAVAKHMPKSNLREERFISTYN